MIRKIYVFFKNEEGAETLEYVIIASIIIVIGIIAYNIQFGTLVSNAYSALITVL